MGMTGTSGATVYSELTRIRCTLETLSGGANHAPFRPTRRDELARELHPFGRFVAGRME
jgi:hypothetical protein